ncbi:hypothetical protein ABIF26_006982 [Bradyrhizobium elkanii]|uniref:hypothetical protein n=1 Tax=Bradyrhizobium elkanii TaxID=29448 RepID=UPI003514AD85
MARTPKYDDAAIEIEAGEFEEPDSEDEAGIRFFVTIVEKSGDRTGVADFKSYYEAVTFAHETAKEFGVPTVHDTGEEVGLTEKK